MYVMHLYMMETGGYLFKLIILLIILKYNLLFYFKNLSGKLINLIKLIV